MSLSTEIQRLHDAKDAIRLAINRKGVQVPSLAKLDDYSGYVDNIQTSTLPAGLSQVTWDDWGRLVSFTTKSNITSIETDAFRVNSSLTSVSMPNVTSIGESAFSGCKSLTSVSMPNVTSISQWGFYSCTSLTSIDIPHVTSINIGTFSNCTSLTSVDIPHTVTNIAQQAFYNCTSLASVTCRATTPPTLGKYAFGSTHADIVFYVPPESVDAYKTDWPTYADYIQAIQS